MRVRRKGREREREQAPATEVVQSCFPFICKERRANEEKNHSASRFVHPLKQELAARAFQNESRSSKRATHTLLLRGISSFVAKYSLRGKVIL